MTTINVFRYSTLKRALTGASLIIALALPGSPALAADGNPVGTWKSSFTTQQGQKMESTLKVKQEGDKLVGFVTGRNGEEMPVENVKMSGDELSFKLVRERNGEKFTAKVTAKLSGDNLKGRLDSNWGGEDRSFDWEATRVRETADVTGAWNYAIAVETGATMKLVLDLKQDGEKVTGKVSVGEFSTPITEGRISGDAITFNIPVETGDTKFTSKYKGILRGDTITGNIESDWGGENHKYDWNATRVKVASAAGTWKWVIVTKDGESVDLSLKLKQDGETLTGVMMLGDDETSISEGTVKDSQVSLKVTRVQDGNTQTSRFQGRLDGDSIKGKIDSDWSGEPRIYDWNARRSS